MVRCRNLRLSPAAFGSTLAAMIRPISIVSLCTALASGCGGGDGVAGPVLDGFDPAPLTDDAALAHRWASIGSAPQVLSAAQLMITAADLTLQLNEGNCPVKTESGDKVTYEGGCTTADGAEWRGRAVADAFGVSYEGFGRTATEECNGQQLGEDVTFDGKVSMSGSPSGLSFDVDIRTDGTTVDDMACVQRASTGAISYSGRLRQDGELDVWSGSGRVGTLADGVADVSTDDEVIDDAACDDEASSGTTTIEGGDHAIVIHYDGATDCDPEHTVRWSLDGVDKGELTDVSCSAGRAPAWGLVVAVCAFALRRRRRAAR